MLESDIELNNHVDTLAEQIVKDLAVDDVVITEANLNDKSHMASPEPATVSSAGRPASPQQVPQPSESIYNNQHHSVSQPATVLEGSPSASATLNSSSSLLENASVGKKNTAAVPDNIETQLPLLKNDVAKVTRRKRRVRSASGSADDVSSLRSGPWSVDWLRNVQNGDIGLISSHKKRLKKVGKGCGENSCGSKSMASKKKAGGVLRHPVLTLKKVARLPSKDREEVMKVLRNSKVLKNLKQKIRNRRRQRERVTRSMEEVKNNLNNETSSMASVNNDWQSCVVLKGDNKTKADDIKGIGETIGVSFTGTNHNKFSVLSRSKKVADGPVLTLVSDEGCGVDVGA